MRLQADRSGLYWLMKRGYGLGRRLAEHPHTFGHPGDPHAGEAVIRKYKGVGSRLRAILDLPQGTVLLPRVAASEWALERAQVPHDAVVALDGAEPGFLVRKATYGQALDLALGQQSAFGYRHPSGAMAYYSLDGRALIPGVMEEGGPFRPSLGAQAILLKERPNGGAAGWHLLGGRTRGWPVLRGPLTRWHLLDTEDDADAD